MVSFFCLFSLSDFAKSTRHKEKIFLSYINVLLTMIQVFSVKRPRSFFACGMICRKTPESLSLSQKHYYGFYTFRTNNLISASVKVKWREVVIGWSPVTA